ncbi:MAG: ABC transporter ATP-binding protein [Clostridiales bacterium]|nr:ABC transporter ATP-binding protein [Clostridiales bacterium]
MPAISVKHLTKDYGRGRGVFDINIEIEKGECYGFLGPNGAGKTTTIRHLMGFSKPQHGSTAVLEKDSWKNRAMLQNAVGYLPGEVTLPGGLSANAFLRMMGQMRNVQGNEQLKMLLDMFDLKTNVSIKQMSLGEKRKLAVVTAFMHDPDILILDEPTSGLDPVGQEKFIEFIRREKQRGKTIFLSSHIFHEVDAVCERIAIIREGKIVSEFKANQLKETHDRIYRISFSDHESYAAFINNGQFNFTEKNEKKLQAKLQIQAGRICELTESLKGLHLADFVEIPFTLEDYFMGFYNTTRHFKGVKQ